MDCAVFYMCVFLYNKKIGVYNVITEEKGKFTQLVLPSLRSNFLSHAMGTQAHDSKGYT